MPFAMRGEDLSAGAAGDFQVLIDERLQGGRVICRRDHDKPSYAKFGPPGHQCLVDPPTCPRSPQSASGGR